MAELSRFWAASLKRLSLIIVSPKAFRPLRNLALRGLLAALAAGAFSGARAGDAPPVMIVPGQFDVSASGAATYSIPIAVPPGTAGMAPSLSLEYSSQSGDGIVGLGFSLSGLPAIGRCPRTVAQDSTRGSVSYDTNDKFCLGGQRLVAISGTYGANNTEYRTEVESFSKIVSYGTAGNGPQYFKVWTKSGQIMEFGNTSDSRFLAVGTSTARAWGVNKVSDAKGNYFAVQYDGGTFDTTNGQAYPTRIDYTGNTGASLSPYNSVRFEYNTSRPDQVALYRAGSLLKTTVLLTRIKTYEGNNVVSDYQITYEDISSYPARRSRVTEINVCDSSGTTCLRPTTFTWQGTRDAVSLTASSISTGQGLAVVPMSDLDSDGLIDYLTYDTGVNFCTTGNEPLLHNSSTSGTFTWTKPSGNQICNAYFQPADINANGLAGAFFYLIYQKATSPYTPGFRYYFMDHSSAGPGLPQLNYVTASGNNTPKVGDFNGDGKTDYYDQGSTSTLYVGDGTGSFSTASAPSYGTIYSTQLMIGDFDGNGCSDIFAQGTYNRIDYFCNPAASTANVTNWTTSTQRVIGDFNGDGLADVLIGPDSSGNAGSVQLSTGTGLTTASGFSVPAGWNSYSIQAGDFNGDGKTDIALIGFNGGTHYIKLSTGASFIDATSFSTASETTSAIIADWNNDGAADLWIKKASGDVQENATFTPELLASIDNGLGGTITITYSKLSTNGSFYTKETSATYPALDVNGAIYVVSQISGPNGIGGTRSASYAYTGAKANQDGRGFLGFHTRKVTDDQTGIVNTTTYNQTFPFTGLVAETKTVSGSVELSKTTQIYADTTRTWGSVSTHFVHVDKTEVTSKDLNGATLPKVTTCYGTLSGSACTPDYDDYGNAETVTSATDGGTTSVTTNTYSNDTTNWYLGRLTAASTTATLGSNSITRSSSFTYESSTGLLLTETMESGVSDCSGNSSSCTLTTSYTYDSFGHRIRTEVSGSGIDTRITKVDYDSKGQFATTIKQCPDVTCSTPILTDTYTFDVRFGSPLTHQDSNSLQTSWLYDGFGRTTKVTKPDGTATTTSYNLCQAYGGSTSCATYLAFYVRGYDVATNGTTQISPEAQAYFDILGRTALGYVRNFANDNWIVSVTEYNSLGQVNRSSRPYFSSGGSPVWTNFTYDTLGRAVTVTAANGTSDQLVTSYDYNGLTTTVTVDPGSSPHKNQVTTTVRNADSDIDHVTDSATGTTYYTYDAYGQLLTVTDPAGNVITNTYDRRGRKISSQDPDMKSWTYAYDVLDQLTSQTDAKSQTTTLSYDRIGRVTTRTEADHYTTWTYGTSAGSYNVGRLIEAKACTNSGCGTVRSKHSQTYDSNGRPYQTAIEVNGASVGSYTSLYDSSTGRLDKVTYPSGFQVQYTYTSQGYPSQLKDAVGGFTYWTANTMNAELQLTQQTLGNGIAINRAYSANTGRISTIQAGTSNSVANFTYGFDLLGNLTSRADGNLSTNEAFCYDALNRLTYYSGVSGNCQGSGYKSVTYNSIGNIATKSDVGTYSYPTSGSTSVRPHAVSSVTGTVNGVTNPTYSYDDNGNLTSGAGRTLQWTSFNMASRVCLGSGGCTSPSTDLAYTYDADHARITQAETTGGVTTATTYLNDPSSGLGSEKVVSGSVTIWNDYLIVAGQRIAQRSIVNGGTPTLKYFLQDHLGSVAVVMDGTGAVVTGGRLTYDPWGRPNAASTLTTRGFTDHEMMPPGPGVALINMNARMYDPELGRFQSADSLVPDPTYSQAFNRYSYVENNPLAFVDPTGHHTADPIDIWGIRFSGRGLGSPGVSSGFTQASFEKETYTPTPEEMKNPCPAGGECHIIFNNPVTWKCYSGCEDKPELPELTDSWAEYSDGPTEIVVTGEKGSVNGNSDGSRTEAGRYAQAPGSTAMQGGDSGRGNLSGEDILNIVLPFTILFNDDLMNQAPKWFKVAVFVGSFLVGGGEVKAISSLARAARSGEMNLAKAEVRGARASRGPRYGRGDNDLQPDPAADGYPHSTWERDSSGQIVKYATWGVGGILGPLYVLYKLYRAFGRPHGGQDPPLVREPAPGKGPGSPSNRARPPEPWETPKKPGGG